MILRDDPELARVGDLPGEAVDQAGGDEDAVGATVAGGEQAGLRVLQPGQDLGRARPVREGKHQGGLRGGVDDAPHPQRLASRHRISYLSSASRRRPSAVGVRRIGQLRLYSGHCTVTTVQLSGSLRQVVDELDHRAGFSAILAGPTVQGLARLRSSSGCRSRCIRSVRRRRSPSGAASCSGTRSHRPD